MEGSDCESVLSDEEIGQWVPEFAMNSPQQVLITLQSQPQIVPYENSCTTEDTTQAYGNKTTQHNFS